MNTVEQILHLFFNNNLKQSEIAKELGISKQRVSKVLNEDSRYLLAKESKKQKNAIKRVQYQKEYQKNYVRKKKDNDSYQQMKAQLEKDSIELSYSNNNISDYAFAKWNSSAYQTNSKGNLVLVKGLKVSVDVPKNINMNIKVPTQKYKASYCVSR